MALTTLLDLPPIPSAVLSFALLFALYKYVLQSAFFGPLSGIPKAHWSAPFSSLWILNQRRLAQETFVVHKAHQRLGPIVRLAPYEISVNSVDGGLRTIYAGGFEKGDWYSNIFCNYGIRPMFAMEGHGPHSKRKRLVSNIYAKSTLQKSEALNAATDILINDRFLPALKELASRREPVEFYTIFSAITMDFVSAYVFGLKNSTNYIQQSDMGRQFFQDYKSRQIYGFWPQEMPRFTKLMTSLGMITLIVPPWVGPANKAIEDLVLDMCEKADKTVSDIGKTTVEAKPEDWPTVHSQLKTALSKECGDGDLIVELDKPSRAQNGSVPTPVSAWQRPTDAATGGATKETLRLSIASEVLDHTLAGFDTSSITLTFFAWELSLRRNREWQESLRKELKTLRGNWDPKEIDALPVLHAVLLETLRLHAAIPGNQPRITPAAASLGPAGHEVHNLPANIRVQSQAWSLHRNPDVFPDPECWDPARWMDSNAAALKEMQRWFWAFGSGGRMCVGSNLAMLDMKAIIAAIWSTFETTIADDSGMSHVGTYVAGPAGKDGTYLRLKLEELVP